MTDQKQNVSGPHQALPRPAWLQLLNVIDTRPLPVVGILMLLGIMLAIIAMTYRPPSLKLGEIVHEQNITPTL